jgi:hypothetical protein
MKFNIFRKANKKHQEIDIQNEWFTLGEKYAIEVKEMVDFGEKNGWENWKGKEPEDKRNHLADSVIQKLREANDADLIDDFRKAFPPAHTPLIKYFEEKGQSIEQMFFIENEKIVFVVGTAYQKRQAYLLDGKKLSKLDSEIEAIGKSKKNGIFAIKSDGMIVTTQGWNGKTIETFELGDTDIIGISILTPFNDGKRILCVTSEGIYLISKDSNKMIHPVPDLDAEEWNSNIDMENATLSNDNRFIIVGDQCSDHRILREDGEEIGKIGPQSSYPHYCLFSEDDSQLITNSCHFYNGITIGVNTSNLEGLKIEAYNENGDFKVIDDGMRVYVGITTSEYYILGDAYGYIKAFNKQGKCIWRHFLGSTIGGLAISDDEKTLWIGSCTGIIHKLRLGKGHRDTHTIGNGNHFEEFRLILWKGEEKELWW